MNAHRWTGLLSRHRRARIGEAGDAYELGYTAGWAAALSLDLDEEAGFYLSGRTGSARPPMERRSHVAVRQALHMYAMGCFDRAEEDDEA